MLKLCAALFFLLAILDFTYSDDIFHPLPKIRSLTRSQIVPGFTSLDNRYTPQEEKNPNYWWKRAQEDLKKRVNRPKTLRVAKNVIFFIGDGLSVPTLTAARIYKGQRLGKPGEESKLAIEEMPYAGFVKTYCTNAQTADSACTGTAYWSGIKTNMFMLGLNANVEFNDCAGSANASNHVETILTWAQNAGKATGIVTTTTVTHASPGAGYAHVANRLWESDAQIVSYGADVKGGCKDIAKQLIRDAPGRNIDVILGGGSKHFLPRYLVDPFGNNGSRLDYSNLISEWKRSNPDGAFVTTRDEMLALNKTNPKRVFGLFNSENMEFHMDAVAKRPTEPRLKDMTVEAIRTLRQNRKGYFLFVEGGRIDHAHHFTMAGYALDETLEFDEAIQAAMDMTDDRETLIVVSSDHSHTMSIAGYPNRGNPIFDVSKHDTDSFGMPYTTLNYAIGNEQYLLQDGQRQNLTGKMTPLSITPSYIRNVIGTHAGDDVGVFASGPYSHLFTGVMEQNELPIMMAYAARILKN